MKNSKQSKALFKKTVSAVFIIVMNSGLVSSLWSGELKSDAPTPNGNSTASKTNSVGVIAGSPDTGTAKVPRQLTGAELYSMHCNRCHAERYPTERTAAQWNTILLHMRVRANLPAEQARTILKYLQENSGR